jgi:hypothetical protein
MTVDALNIAKRGFSRNPQKPLENDIQRQIVAFLDAVLLKSHRVFACPNAARRTKGGHAANAVPGLRPGVPDLLIAGPEGITYYIEVKRPGGRLSPAQEDWTSWLWSNNCPCAVVYGLEDVRSALAAWSIPTREARR